MREYVSKMECEHCRQSGTFFESILRKKEKRAEWTHIHMDLLYSGGLNQGKGLICRNILKALRSYLNGYWRKQKGTIWIPRYLRVDLTDCQLFERMPDVKKQELEERKKGFQESYERLRDSWK